jgi:hypothetical protein
MRKRKFCRRKDFAPKSAGMNWKKKNEIRDVIANINWKKLGWVLKK